MHVPFRRIAPATRAPNIEPSGTSKNGDLEMEIAVNASIKPGPSRDGGGRLEEFLGKGRRMQRAPPLARRTVAEDLADLRATLVLIDERGG